MLTAFVLIVFLMAYLAFVFLTILFAFFCVAHAALIVLAIDLLWPGMYGCISIDQRQLILRQIKNVFKT
jgi:hypothetical protein